MLVQPAWTPQRICMELASGASSDSQAEPQRRFNPSPGLDAAFTVSATAWAMLRGKTKLVQYLSKSPWAAGVDVSTENRTGEQTDLALQGLPATFPARESAQNPAGWMSLRTF